MKCELIQYQLGAYTAGELPPESSLYIEQHLRTCPACQAWHKELQEMSSIWGQPEIEMDFPDMTADIMDNIRQMPPLYTHQTSRLKPRDSRKSMFTHFTVAACLAFCLFQFGVFEQLGTGITDATQKLSNSVDQLLKEVKR
ncbi:zf-HC2 domain-containing protein [Paenibacillus sp.]|jgi:anti-sigma factor RsiW|uniref:zf-HC2 domain-containing protein n=1 Tax=Paenibacillus sp. TaxID=58172 RepID=UPI00282DCF89|nr:zf-HC2 domain-containing protein [Paenibacillus sp.]MDR0266688.1 zf-HC2 domain-containing protein [Paenibacillus sp.]